MAAELGKDFAKEQKIWIKRAMKGRPLFFGLQAKAAKSGKFLLSKKPGEVKPNKVKELSLYEGKDADKKNKVPGSAAMGVATGENGVLTLHFERGKALPVATKFVKHFVTREVKFKLVKKVVIKEAELLPDVPEKSDADGFQPTEETIRERAVSLAQRLKNLGDDQSKLAQKIKDALALAATDPNAADDALDELEFILGAYERLASLEKLLDDTAAQPGVAAEIVTSIRTKRLQVARQQLDSEQIDEADDNMDVAEQAIANLRKSAGLPEGTAKVSAPGPQDDDASVDDEKAAQFFRDWIAGLKPDLARLNEAKSSELPQISEHVKSVVQAIDKKDWKAATAGYKQADPLITSALKALQAKQVQQTVSAAQLTSTLGDDAKPALKAVLESSKCITGWRPSHVPGRIRTRRS